MRDDGTNITISIGVYLLSSAVAFGFLKGFLEQIEGKTSSQNRLFCSLSPTPSVIISFNKGSLLRDVPRASGLLSFKG
jgi:hypothetical protein